VSITTRSIRKWRNYAKRSIITRKGMSRTIYGSWDSEDEVVIVVVVVLKFIFLVVEVEKVMMTTILE